MRVKIQYCPKVSFIIHETEWLDWYERGFFNSLKEANAELSLNTILSVSDPFLGIYIVTPKYFSCFKIRFINVETNEVLIPVSPWKVGLNER